MKEQTRNTEIQINEEEIGKLPEKRIQNYDSKDDRKLWKQNGENSRINKDLEELKNKHAETTQLLKLKIL